MPVKEGITADLEAMNQAGLGGTYLMPIKGINEGAQYNGKAQQLTPEWWEMVRFSMEEANRLGLKLGMHICDGFALAGGPSISPVESIQKVVWSDAMPWSEGVSNYRSRNLLPADRKPAYHIFPDRIQIVLKYRTVKRAESY